MAPGIKLGQNYGEAMRIDIQPALEDKLLIDSASMKMSPTQYVNYLIEIIIVIKEPEKIHLTPPKPAIKPIKSDKNFATGWK